MIGSAQMENARKDGEVGMIMIDTDMPDNCEGCFAQQEYYNPRFDETEYSCGISGRNLGTHSRQDLGEWHCDRPEWCPIKEQKAVKPKSKVRHGAYTQIQHFCGNCNSMLYGKLKFCRVCGQAVKWDD